MKYTQKENVWFCECGREFTSRQAVTSHIHRTHAMPGVSYGGHQKGQPAWNKGLTKEKDERVLKNSLSISKSMKGKIGRPHTEETKRKLSKIMSIHNKGGRSKWYNVSGQSVQGTWERDIAQKLDEMGIVWKKLKTNQHTFEYEMDGKWRCYTPDFYLPDYGVYLEIKGYWWGNDKKKMEIVVEKYNETKFVIIEKNEYDKIMRGELVW